ncbi:MAG TPA: PfkB family carbohydrate kinase [Candidatus Bathyarchaeia archaeon]|nr:PfkB family carbohydrate kinase [Candidatus Bathyarchaeia archaeon]
MLEKLQNLKHTRSVVVLNDFFLDRIVKISNVNKVYQQIIEKSEFGGSIRGISQKDIKGGNATNVAYALARLGCPVTLITVADKASTILLKETFSEFQHASLFVIDGKPGRTTSLEFLNENKIVNIMLSDLGDNENFGPEKLGTKEQEAIKRSSAVMVANWASNEKGTELCKFVFEKSPDSLHFLDPADIQTRASEFKEAIRKIGPLLDSLCVNENECNILQKQYGLECKPGIKETKKSLLNLSKKASIPIDLHTSTGACWSNGKDVDFVQSFSVKPNFVTGAGDVWDAANIVGYLANLDTHERLLFANGAASLYVGNTQGIPPTLNEVMKLITK